MAKPYKKIYTKSQKLKAPRADPTPKRSPRKAQKKIGYLEAEAEGEGARVLEPVVSSSSSSSSSSEGGGWKE